LADKRTAAARQPSCLGGFDFDGQQLFEHGHRGQVLAAGVIEHPRQRLGRRGEPKNVQVIAQPLVGGGLAGEGIHRAAPSCWRARMGLLAAA